ncbi:MAG: ATP-dependent helicase [Lachnospiraceae bacterium]|nr:ATP-dependent helicase [Lachnospiraceae bacterium]
MPLPQSRLHQKEWISIFKFNEAQQKAIIHGEGPMLVLAGPGSGKTAVITRRVLELTRKGVAPGNILVITFTKAAATEMQERYMRLQKEEGEVMSDGRVNFGTFHAVFFKILKYAYHWDASNIIREEISTQMLSDIIRKLALEIEDEREFIDGIRSEISRIKSERIDIKNYYSMNCPEEQFQRIYFEYTEKMKEQRLLDFDDILLYTYELLEQRPDILKLWQDKYQYILIDEFQDINRIQYDIIRMLALPQNNLFVVGDDDQSIYQFRGARPEIMLQFPRDYQTAEQILLNYNYRSGEEIVKAAGRLISHNKKRYPKEILATRQTGIPVVSEKFPSQEEEGERIIELIRDFKAQGIPYQEMAVLFRTNTQARGVMRKLLNYNIPFQMRDLVPNLFEHWIARDMITYIRLAMGRRDRGLMLRIMNRPNRYLSRELLQEAVVDFNLWKQRYRDRDWMADRIDKLEYDLEMIAKANPYAAVNYIRRGIGYDEYLMQYAEYRRMKPEDLFEIVTELQESAREFETFEAWFAYMEQYKKELERRKEQREKRNADGVVLATMHSSKGLEYEVVILPEVNEGISPYKRAVSEEELEEERRMYYVAMTRAKRYLYIFSVKRLHGKEMELSRFVGEMDLSAEELLPGTHVIHKTFGKGIVTVQEKERVRIYFASLDAEKIFHLDVCRKNNVLKTE